MASDPVRAPVRPLCALRPGLAEHASRMRSASTIVAALCLTFGLAACDEGEGESGTASDTRSVFVVRAHYELGTQGREFAATVVARNVVDQSFRVAGKVVRRRVEVGQTVRAGDTLASLDSTDLNLHLTQAEAELAAATVATDTAGAEAARAEQLRTKEWVSTSALERARSLAQDARSRQQRAADAVALARNALSYAELRADVDGVVTQTLVEAGQVVAGGQSVVRLAAKTGFEAEVALPEVYVDAARGGDASLILWSKPDTTYRVALRELSPIADRATRTFNARFTILEPDAGMMLGQSARLALVNKDRRAAVAVPLSAIFTRAQGAAIWKVEGGHLVPVHIEVTRLSSQSALISGDVGEGDAVVALGAQKLDGHETVRIVETRTFM